MQPVNMDSLQLQATTFYTFLYFRAYIHTPMHILLNIRRKAVNLARWLVTGHLINAAHYIRKKKNCKRISKNVPILVSNSKAKAQKKNRRKIKKTTKKYKKFQKIRTPENKKIIKAAKQTPKPPENTKPQKINTKWTCIKQATI